MLKDFASRRYHRSPVIKKTHLHITQRNLIKQQGRELTSLLSGSAVTPSGRSQRSCLGPTKTSKFGHLPMSVFCRNCIHLRRLSVLLDSTKLMFRLPVSWKTAPPPDMRRANRQPRPSTSRGLASSHANWFRPITTQGSDRHMMTSAGRLGVFSSMA